MALVVVRQSDYQYERLRRDVFGILSRISSGTVVRGAKVLVKPNLLAAAKAGKAITTHPMVVRAACEFALEQGARVLVGDSPPMGSFWKIVHSNGLDKALEDLPVALREMGEPRPTHGGEKFRDLQISSAALDSDAIINLPKLKTHSQMSLTLAVKNLFGCIVGISKADWHLRAGENREHFAEMLVSLFSALPPSVNLLDGVLAMEGDGPGSGGTPRRLGVLAGSDSAPALDEVACKMVGLRPAKLPTCKAARDFGLVPEYTVEGDVQVFDDFAVPMDGGILFGPRLLRGLLRHHLTTRPVCMGEACEMCGQCIRICPARSLAGNDGQLRFDYDRCIRCYCCLEVCPHGALRRHEPLLHRVMRRLF